jgi:hypothetical protein
MAAGARKSAESQPLHGAYLPLETISEIFTATLTEYPLTAYSKTLATP